MELQEHTVTTVSVPGVLVLRGLCHQAGLFALRYFSRRFLIKRSPHVLVKYKTTDRGKM